MVPEANFKSQLEGPKLPKSGSKRLLARIWPKMARAQWSQKQNFNGQLEAPNDPNLAKAPGQDLAQNGPFPMVLEVNFNSQLEGSRLPKSGSKRLLARIWPKGPFPVHSCMLLCENDPKTSSFCRF